MTDRIPTILYRHFNRAGDLLYVGISLRPFRRTKEHRGDKDWWPEVATTTYEEFPSRETALAAEATAIRTESPLHNIAGRLSPLEQRKLTEEQRQWDRLVALVPQAEHLVELSRIIGRVDNSPHFCANSYWYGYRLNGDPQMGFRTVLNHLVGVNTERQYSDLNKADHHFVTGFCQAHDLLYDRAYNALPDCQHFDVGNGSCHSHKGRLDTYAVLDLPGVDQLDLPFAAAIHQDMRHP